ncbi:hypothetical protein HDV05_001020 [Chytridiales sp. JEL 0842]|nr:hypothetical protein HDV05_001020 [Chytridiales sp. JEL 0842]
MILNSTGGSTTSQFPTSQNAFQFQPHDFQLPTHHQQQQPATTLSQNFINPNNSNMSTTQPLPLSAYHLQQFIQQASSSTRPLSPASMILSPCSDKDFNNASSLCSSIADSESDTGSLFDDTDSIHSGAESSSSPFLGFAGLNKQQPGGLLSFLQQHNHDPEKKRSTKKRPRATATQLSVLENVFSETHHPDSAKRKQLAGQLGMTERSVQIWFQNKRARLRQNERRFEPLNTSLQNTDPNNSNMSPNHFLPLNKRHLTSTALRPSTPPSALYASPAASPIKPLHTSSTSNSFSKQLELDLPASILLWGTWRRTLSHPSLQDLKITADLSQRLLNLLIHVSDSDFRVSVPFTSLKNITYTRQTRNSSIHPHLPTGAESEDVLTFELNTAGPLSFSMFPQSRSPEGKFGSWIPCGDFTEHEQASTTPVFSVHAPAGAGLLQAFESLVGADAGLGCISTTMTMGDQGGFYAQQEQQEGQKQQVWGTEFSTATFAHLPGCGFTSSSAASSPLLIPPPLQFGNLNMGGGGRSPLGLNVEGVWNFEEGEGGGFFGEDV